jgi:hypothetical protein
MKIMSERIKLLVLVDWTYEYYESASSIEQNRRLNNLNFRRNSAATNNAYKLRVMTRENQLKDGMVTDE